ncbi:MAG: hypothetical protein ACOYNC_12275 [Bacteroidales bacterium]
MKRYFLLVASAASIYCSAQKPIDKQHFFTLLDNRNYGQMLVDAHAIRKEVYGKSWLIDYFIAKAECGLGKKEKAVEWYNYIFEHYKQNEKSRKFLLSEVSACGTEQLVTSATVSRLGMPDRSMLTSTELPVASVSGKQGPVYNCKMPVQGVANVRPITAEELESRLFSIDQSEAAVRKYRSILGSNYKINVSGRFILITSGTSVLNNEQATQTAGKLEKAYHFYTSHYNLRPPDKLLAVYLLPDQRTFQQTAILIHGIMVPDVNIGYSNITDLSLVGIGDAKHIGTMYHELFHLMVRTDVGDVPPWVDEGIASIYETSLWNGDVLSGKIENWRTSVLGSARQDMPDKIPHLGDFITLNWKKFDGQETNDICQAAINYAYGKHLMLYLQEQGKLPGLLTAVKNRNEVNNDLDVVFRTDGELLEQTFNCPVDSVEAHFEKWVAQTYRISLHKSETEINTRTFFEEWDRQAWKFSLLNPGKTKEDLHARYEAIKIKYDSLKEQTVLEAPNEMNATQQQMTPQFQGSNFGVDHTVIAAAERQMKGLDVLRKELEELVRELDAILKN